MLWRWMFGIFIFGMAIVLIGSNVTSAGETTVPPVRPPGEKLIFRGKEVYEGRRIITEQDSYPRSAAKLVQEPSVKKKGGRYEITFALDKPDDVLVRIVDAKGNMVRELACGVLGWNAPAPLKFDALKQTMTWDGKDSEGKPAPDGCRVVVGVGLAPRLDGFVGYDINQLTNYIAGMEVDSKGRVYVTLFTERRGDPEIRRYERDGTYVETLFPANPNHIKENHEELLGKTDNVDGTIIPERRGPWPFIMYKWHHWSEAYPWGSYTFPFRIAENGKAYILSARPNKLITTLSEKQQQHEKFRNRCKAKALPIDLDDPTAWFVPFKERPDFGAGPWALGADGQGYQAFTSGGSQGCLDPTASGETLHTIRKINLATGFPSFDFEYNGTAKLPEKRCYLGTPAEPGLDPEHFSASVVRTAAAGVEDITVDSAGNIYVADYPGIKMYRPNGQFIDLLKETEAPDSPHNVRFAGGALYALFRAGSQESKPAGKIPRKGAVLWSWKKMVLVKYTGVPDEPKVVWKLDLPKEARHIAVDTHISPNLVWVGNGNGPATFSRITDEGDKPGEIRHFGKGVRKGILINPWSLAVDAKGRVFTHDYERRRNGTRGVIVRTNDDGSEWLESKPVAWMTSMCIDRKNKRLYQNRWGSMGCLDLDFKTIKGPKWPRGMRYLGATDSEGNLYTSGTGKTTLGKTSNGLIDKIGPDGSLKKAGYIELHQGRGGLAMDSTGHLYAMDTCKEGFFVVAHDLGAPKANVVWERAGKKFVSQSHLAYIVKFAPGGGARGTNAELWAHRGVSPVLSQCKCPLITNSMAVDAAGRIYATDYVRYHVKVVDPAGNMICRIGGWGNADCMGPDSKFPKPEIAFSWLHGIDAFGDFLYASDKDLRRIVKVRMGYREVKKVSIP